MLVLTRKPDQQIQIGENIRITIVRVKGQSVRIGIEAPREIHVMRTELIAGESAPQQSAVCHEATATPSMPQIVVAKPASATNLTEDSAVEGRRNPFPPLAGRTPGASSATLVRRQQRLGPAVLRSMAGRI